MNKPFFVHLPPRADERQRPFDVAQLNEIRDYIDDLAEQLENETEDQEDQNDPTPQD